MVRRTRVAAPADPHRVAWSVISGSRPLVSCPWSSPVRYAFRRPTEEHVDAADSTAVKSAAQILESVEAEIRAGRTWRAKEILRGTISGGRVDPLVLERYGRLLDALGDRLEAGKYLFLSGARATEYDEPIRLFRQRYSRCSPRQLVTALPSAVRRLTFAELPTGLQDELRSLQVPVEAFGKHRERQPRYVPRPLVWWDRVLIIGAVFVVAIFLFALVLGIGTIASWIWDFFV